MHGEEQIKSEIAFVLFADIVGYSLLSLEEQAAIANRFKGIARGIAEEFGCPMALDSGDGIALVFFGNVTPAADCLVALGEGLSREKIGARVGMHCGPLTRVEDVNGRPNVVGPAVNMAERIMSSGDAGHLLLSGAAAEMISPSAKWSPLMVDLGEHEVKHGVVLRVFNLVTEGCGRSELPSKLREEQARRRKNNFTAPDRPFVGRKAELERLTGRLQSGQERLITLTGPGGMGKSRLALQVAQEIAPNYADGAWVIECDALETRDELIAQIASVLSIETGQGPMASVLEAVAERQLLLVVDCFEKVVREARVLDELVKHTKEVQIIVTSRTLLGLSRESEFVLSPLSFKKEGTATADAIALFIGAAKAVDPEFRITRRNQETVHAVVRAVEGIPLAIILAAGRLRHLSLAELAEQLGKRRLEILKRRVSGEDRHADLARVVDDSFVLLRAELKELLISLSIFSGFHIRDVEAVLQGVPDLLEGVSELRENSLLTAAVVDAQMRYRCLDVVAEYIEGIADESKLTPLRRVHSEHFARRASTLREMYEDGRWRDANAGFGAEFGNYHRAIEYAVATMDPALVQPLSRSLSRILMESGYRADFEKLASASMELAAKENDIHLLIEATGLLGGVNRRDKRFQEAEAQWLKRAHYCTQVGDIEKEADTWLDLAQLALDAGDPPKADQYLSRFSELEQKLDLGFVYVSGQMLKAMTAVKRGKKSEAKILADEARSLAERLPLRMHAFYVWTQLADVYNQVGEPKLSEGLCLEGIRQTLHGRHFSYAGHLLCKLASSLELQQRTDQAAISLAIAEMIPKSVSQSLRDQIRALREAFVKDHGLQSLRTCEDSLNGLDWQIEAFGLVEKLRGNQERTAT